MPRRIYPERPQVFEANIYNVTGWKLPAIKIQGTIYLFTRDKQGKLKCRWKDSQEYWNGIYKPSGWSKVAMIKVHEHNCEWATWAMRRWLGE